MRSLFLLLFTVIVALPSWAQSPSDLAYKRCNDAKGPTAHIIEVCAESLKENQLTVRSRARIHAIRGNAYRRLGEYSKALSEYETAIHIDSKYPHGYNGRALVKGSQGDRQGAMADVNLAIALDPNNPIFLRNRAKWLQEAGDLSSITEYNQIIKLEPKEANNYYGRALAIELAGDHEGAIADYTKAIEINPNFHQAYYNRALRQKNASDKLRDLDSAIKIWPEFPYALAARGQEYGKMARYDEAIADLNKAIRNSPQFPFALISRAWAWSQKGDFDKSIADYSEAIALDPTADTYERRARVWEKKGNIERARADMAAAHRLDSTRIPGSTK